MNIKRVGHFDGMQAAVIAAATVIGMVAVATPAAAFDHNRGGCNSAECYEKVRQPDVYGSVHRPVVIAPAHTEVVHLPAAIQLRPQRVEVVPGRWHASHSPALYGHYQKHVLAKRAQVSVSHTPAVYKTVHEQVVGSPHVRWERRVDAHGVERMCKVVTPGRMMSMARRVMVSPAHTSETVIPASYRTVTRSALVQKAKTHHTYQYPVHQWVTNTNMIRPATQQTIHNPAVWGTEKQTVMLRRGGHAWQPVGQRNSCPGC
jgi:hypothetical protein